MVAIQRTTARFVREHLQALHTGSMVTGWFRKGREPEVLHVTPENVLAALRKAGINCVLMGVHGINVYRDEPRATGDVDVLVTKREVRKAIRVLEETFPYLELRENSVVARFVNLATLKVVIDVMKPASRAMQTVFRHSVAIGKGYRIPSLHMAITLKFLSMTAINRVSEKRLLDAGDFTNMVKTHRQELDLEELKKLGDKAQPRAGSKILELISQIDAGRTIQVSDHHN